MRKQYIQIARTRNGHDCMILEGKPPADKEDMYDDE
jgi:hypothetical protein